ncbi:hypothetical protein PCAR4_80123 [Paraburkholderia caribensis]|nr:hypothetical protein PCAR4_80123 [Paraburkholderia caribensis]
MLRETDAAVCEVAEQRCQYIPRYLEPGVGRSSSQQWVERSSDSPVVIVLTEIGESISHIATKVLACNVPLCNS